MSTAIARGLQEQFYYSEGPKGMKMWYSRYARTPEEKENISIRVTEIYRNRIDNYVTLVDPNTLTVNILTPCS